MFFAACMCDGGGHASIDAASLFDTVSKGGTCWNRMGFIESASVAGRDSLVWGGARAYELEITP